MREPSALRHRGSLAIAMACLAACLVACGQKGPLRLPEKSGAVVVKPAPGAPAPQGESAPRPAERPPGER